MATIIDNLNTIVGIKEDIRNAITDKGVDMVDVPFSEFPDKIATIETGLTTIDVAEYSIKFINSPLTEIPEIFDFSNVTDYSYMFTNCENLTGSPIGDSIVVNSGDYAFYKSNIQIPSNIHKINSTSTFNMIGGGKITTTDELELDIVCDNFPFNIISNAEYAGFLYITLGKSYVAGRDGDYGEEHQLFNNFECNYIAIKPQPDQELSWLIRGCTADTITLGDNSSSFNHNRHVDFLVNNCKNFTLEGDYSNYGWETLSNGERNYSNYIFNCIGIYGCKNLKGDFNFTNADTDIYRIRDFINNIGSVPVEDGCKIQLLAKLEELLTDEEIAIIVSKGYSVNFE